MKYYEIVNGEVKLREKGIWALKELGLTLDELKSITTDGLKERFSRISELGCRIPFSPEEPDSRVGTNFTAKNGGEIPREEGSMLEKGTIKEHVQLYKNEGRFPANLLVSNSILEDGRIREATKSGYNWEESNQDNPTHITKNIKSGVHYGDSGGFSRYFSLDAWWQKKLSELPEGVQRTFPFLITPKPSKREKNKGCENFEEKVIDCLHGNKDGTLNKRTKGKPSTHKNTHPSVKPIKLFSWLTILGSRKGDIVLDPFCGSGTTCISALLMGRKFIGIDMTKDYVKIARARVEAWKKEMKHNE